MEMGEGERGFSCYRERREVVSVRGGRDPREMDDGLT